MKMEIKDWLIGGVAVMTFLQLAAIVTLEHLTLFVQYVGGQELAT